ncbi:MAG: type I-U CRISPR-associated protein Csb2 [Microbacteriaceae bacterium]|nr:type I-U CRISPR-associated protein Csb2 [Microbacteriaceae bacterium]MCI1207535.1 type I-U CRISPR-associated protein Csb2 [Microbacteriaceae bacterium]
MSFAIAASFLLDTYQGHDRYGNIELYPAPLRLFSAIVAAAYTTARRSAGNADASLSDGDVRMLTWLEHTPPDAIELPAAIRCGGRGARAFRRKGWTQQALVGGPDRPDAAEPAAARSALDGPIVWWWKRDPDRDIIRRLGDLCGEVPYLGETGSPVVLTGKTAERIPEGALVRADDAGIGERGLIAFDVPAPGRAEALQRQFLLNRSGRVPTLAADRATAADGRPKKNERDRPDPWTVERVLEQVPYRRPGSCSVASDLPWNVGFLVRVSPVDGPRPWRPEPDARCDWAVALHQAIVSRIGPDAGPAITGRYVPGTLRPANTMAVQVLDAGLPLRSDLRCDGNASLLVLLSTERDGATSDDVDGVQAALAGLSEIRAGRPVLSTAGIVVRREPLGRVRVDEVSQVDPGRLWAPVSHGSSRWWTPQPLAVAETRAPNRSGPRSRRPWTVDDALRVAVGNLLRDRPGVRTTAHGDRRLRELSQRVHDLGVRIGGAHSAYPRHPERYVHHVRAGSPITPLQGMIHFGGILSDTAVTAIGQSRHFGVGLLVPVDLPDPVEVAWTPEPVSGEESDNE